MSVVNMREVVVSVVSVWLWYMSGSSDCVGVARLVDV